MERKENQRTMLTKRLIKEGLTELLAEESIHKISIRALCERAGINRSTFYKYYGSQYDVLAELEEELLARIQEALGMDGADAASTGRILGAVCAYLEEHMSLVQVLVGNNVDPAFPEKLFSLPQIRQIAMGRLGDRYDEEDRRYIYIFVINGAYHLLRAWVEQERRRPFHEVALLLQELIDRVCGQV